MSGDGPERVSDGRFTKRQKRQPNGKFLKGEPRHPKAGRRKGTPNKTTRAVKEFLAELCDDERVHRAVKKRIYRGDTIAFFRALEHVIGKPKETADVNLNVNVYEWGKR